MLPASRLMFFLVTLTAASVCPPDFQEDMVIVIDSDGSTGEDNYRCFKDLITKLIASFHMGKNLVRVGIVSYDTDPKTILKLTGDKDLILKATGDMEYRHNKIDTIVCLSVALSLFNRSEPRDKKVKSIVVLVTDGTEKKQEYTIRTAQRLKDKGIKVFVMGVKPRVNSAELQGVASEPQYYLESKTYDDLADLAQDLVYLICYDNPELHNAK